MICCYYLTWPLPFRPLCISQISLKSVLHHLSVLRPQLLLVCLLTTPPPTIHYYSLWSYLPFWLFVCCSFSWPRIYPNENWCATTVSWVWSKYITPHKVILLFTTALSFSTTLLFYSEKNHELFSLLHQKIKLHTQWNN